MTLLTIVLALTSSVCAAVSIFLFRRWAAVNRRLAGITRVEAGIQSVPAAIPDIVMMDSPSIRFRIGKKILYVRPLTLENRDIFIKEYAQFLRLNKTQLEGLELYKFDKLMDLDSKEAQDLIEKAAAVFSHSRVSDAFAGIIERVILSDAPSNPDKIKLPYLMKHLDLNKMCQIFYAIYGYNVGFEKKNLLAQLRTIGMAFSSEKDTDSAGYTKNMDMSPESGYVSPFQDNPFYPEHLKKSTHTTKSSEKKEIVSLVEVEEKLVKSKG